MNDKTKNIAFFILISIFFLIFEIIYPLLGFNYDSFSLRTKVLLMFLKYIVFLVILVIRYHKYLKEKGNDCRNN